VTTVFYSNCARERERERERVGGGGYGGEIRYRQIQSKASGRRGHIGSKAVCPFV
jgi:hypothetical protein